MNHPERSEWMSYLYDETATGRRGELTAHLATCADCQRQIETWRQTRDELNGWILPQSRRAPASATSVARWGAAALFLVGLGFGVGRRAAPTPNISALRTEVTVQLRAEFQNDLKTSLAAERREWVALLKEMDTRHGTDYAALRKDLETVAVVADARIQRTQRDLGEIAAYTKTSFSPQQ
ncbi:MAG: hypothetical protein H7X97_02580 [Opitutaceae bacterium]|nr:hypothetical protein [Verrucomicrobiales bacterium]